MLDVGGSCSIASFVYDTAVCMAWVHAGPAQVLCGFKRQCILFAWRRGHQRRGAMRARQLTKAREEWADIIAALS